MKTASLLSIFALVSTALSAPVLDRRQNRNGRCGTTRIIFRNGLDGRSQAAFQAANLNDFNQGSALNIQIVANFICDRLQSPCGAPPETIERCRQAAAAASQAAQDETAANTFNNILGEGAAPARRQVQQNQRNVVGRLNLDLGSCTDPTMVLLPGLNGRPQTEFTFIPANSAEFGGQQEALNPNIIANFICDTFTNRCDASEEAKAQCQIAKQAVAAVPERGQAAADAFNAALGF